MLLIPIILEVQGGPNLATIMNLSLPPSLPTVRPDFSGPPPPLSLLLIGNRTGTAVKVQEILTNMGCFIKTRLGLHEGSPQECSNSGMLILEILGNDEDKQDLVSKLETLSDVKVKLVEMSL